MKKRKLSFYLINYIVLIITFVASMRLQATEQETEHDLINTINHEMRIFRDALKSLRKCIQHKTCSRKEKQAMYKAAKHGTVIIGLLALISGSFMYAHYHGKKKREKEALMDELRIIGTDPTALFMALLQNRFEDAQKIFASKQLKKEDLNWVLGPAVLRASKEGIEMLLKQGASAQFITPDNEKVSLLLTALNNKTMTGSSDEDKADIIDLLIQHGAHIDHINFPLTKQLTVLMEAAKNNNLPVVKKLLERGADKTLKDISGETAFDYAIKHGASDEIRQLLSDGYKSIADIG